MAGTDRVEMHHAELDHTTFVGPRQVETYKRIGYKPVPKSRKKADTGDKEK